MERNIPFSRDSSSLRELLRNLVNTPVHTRDREELCSVLDAFQFEQEDEVMDVIQSGDQYKTLDELDDEDVEEMASEEFEETREGEKEEETLEDWENDEWGPEGWSKEGEVNVEGFDMEAFEPETMDEPDGNDSSSDDPTSERDDALPDPEDIPPREEMYENALSLFKDLSRLVDGKD